MADSKIQTKKEYSKPVIAACLALNVLLSISIVLLNKAVYTHIHFPNMTLTMIHFIFTSIGMFICRMFGLFTVKQMPLLKMIPISITFCGFVVLTNLSLQSNTVGTYQIIKTLTTPGIMVIQAFFYNRSFSTKVKLTLVRKIMCAYIMTTGKIVNFVSVLYDVFAVMSTHCTYSICMMMKIIICAGLHPKHVDLGDWAAWSLAPSFLLRLDYTTCHAHERNLGPGRSQLPDRQHGMLCH